MKKDLRIRILEYFNSLQNSTGENVANKWLSEQESDLGKIRRALIELIESDYLTISGKNTISDCVEWLEDKMDTTTKGARTPDHNDKKSSLRLNQKVGNHPEVPKLRLYTKLKGIVFIQDYNRNKREVMIKIIYILIAASIGFISKIAIDYLNSSSC